MYQELLSDARYHDFVLACDRDLATAARRRGCPKCGGVLHAAPFMRKPKGRPIKLGAEHDQRFSFCCAVDGCRSRLTPSSLRFLGRKVYLGAVILLVGLMRGQATAAELAAFTAMLGIKRRTLGRWRRWWLSAFAHSRFWQTVSALLMPPADIGGLPGSLIERFAGAISDRLIACLRFLAPITGGAAEQVF